MHISKLTIRNFRNFQNATFLFTENVNTLIGENGSGKTNVFYAIRLLLDDSLPRTVKLHESDFNRSLSLGWQGQWIIIQIEFSNLDDSEGIQMLAHRVEQMDGSSKGTYNMYYRPKMQKRKRLYELYQLGSSKEELIEELQQITLDDYELVFTSKGTADFAEEGVYLRYVGDFENVIFPNPEEEALDVLGVASQKFSIYEEVTCTYIKALRDAEYEMRSVRNNPLLNLLRDIGKQIDGTDIVAQVNTLNNSIGGLAPIQELRDRVKQTVLKAVGLTYAPNIDIKSQLPAELEKLLQSLTLWVGDNEDGGYQGQVGELSLGGANLIYISLKLLEYELKQSTDKVAHFLLIEEPEAHIHTHIQKTLFEKYGYQNTQVIISTHSTHISAASNIRSVNILAKRANEAAVFQPSKGLNEGTCTKIERYLDTVRSTLLFAKGIILVEGDAELILIPIMFKKVFNISLDEIGVSLINMNSAVFKHIAILFHDDRIQRKCAILTDLDKSIVPLGANKTDDNKFEKGCRDSEESGARRKVLLDIFCDSNQWVKPFYATYTFEVDFVISRNSWEVIKTLPQIYKSEKYIKASNDKLKTHTPEVAGKEMLHLAEKEGKGWLALLIADHINYNTYIPEYIMNAIAFTCEHFNESHFEAMADYRVRKIIDNEQEDLELKATAKDLTSKKLALIETSRQAATSYVGEFMKLYKNDLPNDQLTKLLDYMGR